MSSPTIFSSPPLQPSLGRSAAPDARWWRRAGRALWRGLEAAGRARARTELLRLAKLREGANPELASQLRQAAGRPD